MPDEQTWRRARMEEDPCDSLYLVYTPWEETPGGRVTPKPEGYDEMYQKLGMKFYDLKPLNDCAPTP